MITVELFHIAFEEYPRHVATRIHGGQIQDALEHAYRGTQNLESTWVESRGQAGVALKPTAPVLLGCRSTSVGDYARVTARGRESYWRCCPMGWREIPDQMDLTLTGEALMLLVYAA